MFDKNGSKIMINWFYGKDPMKRFLTFKSGTQMTNLNEDTCRVLH